MPWSGRARERERTARNTASRRARWLSRKGWRRSSAGNPWIRTPDGYRVVVFPCDGGWSGIVEHRGQQIVARRLYESEDRAKLAAFDAILALERRLD
jgi:hypothetical protein